MADLLLTGGTGHLGFRVLVEALEAGYSVRIAVRSLSKVDNITSAESIKALSPGDRISFVEVPDILAPGAYDEALKGVKYVIHCASPLAHATEEDYQTVVVDPAIKGTTGILKSALKVASIKRIVITSSVMANLDLESANPAVTTPESRQPTPASHSYANIGAAYRASKICALNATDDFIATAKPRFDIINVMPAFILGRSELAADAKAVASGSNGIAIGHLLGSGDPGSPMLESSVYLRDAARIHVLALQPKVQGNQSFGASVDFKVKQIFAVVQKHFPDAVKKGIFKDHKQTGKSTPFDSSKTEKMLGIKFVGLEQQIVEIAAQYLEKLGEI